MAARPVQAALGAARRPGWLRAHPSAPRLACGRPFQVCDSVRLGALGPSRFVLLPSESFVGQLKDLLIVTPAARPARVAPWTAHLLAAPECTPAVVSCRQYPRRLTGSKSRQPLPLVRQSVPVALSTPAFCSHCRLCIPTNNL